MKKNMGQMDRVIRIFVAILALVVSFIVPSLVAQVLLWVVAAVALVTSSIGTCPAYLPFHISTKK